MDGTDIIKNFDKTVNYWLSSSDDEISEEYANWLDKITSFNINARYEDYKREFYSLCTASYTEEWITKITTLQKWIKQML